MRKKVLTRVHLRKLRSLSGRIYKLARDVESRPWGDMTAGNLWTAHEPISRMLRAFDTTPPRQKPATEATR